MTGDWVGPLLLGGGDDANGPDSGERKPVSGARGLLEINFCYRL